MIKTEEECLKDFLMDINCLEELSPWAEKFNIFDVLKISTMEIRHSNVLAWLLNPNENHGFGDSYIRALVQRLTEKDEENRYDIFKILLLDMYDFCVYREWNNIDILLVSSEENFLIAIENKIGSSEHDNQLNRYRKILENRYPNYEKIYIYLTPDGEEPSDISNWDVLSYVDVVEILEKLYFSSKLQEDVKLMVKNYIEVLRRYVVKDEKLIDVCNKIYNKHKKALDLIYENRIDEETQIRSLVKETLIKIESENTIIYDDSWNYVFRTKEMDKLLPLLSEPISSWGSTNIYCFWIKITKEKICGIFELSGWNIPDSKISTVKKLIEQLKPKDKNKDDFRCKRLYKTNWYDINDFDNLEETINKRVREIIKELTNMQRDLIIKINKKI